MSKLTNTACKNAKPKDKNFRLWDGKGLYLEVSPSGGKHWYLKYRFAGKEKRVAFGAYPLISLKDARRRCNSARELRANGIDPLRHKKAMKKLLEIRMATIEKYV